jgi:hypothetical protein
MATNQSDRIVTAPHPYAEFEGSPTWEIVEAALAHLEANGDLARSTSPTHVVGYLCEQLARLGDFGAGTVAVWRVLRSAGWPLEPDPHGLLALATSLAGIASAGDVRHVALHLRDLPSTERRGLAADPAGQAALAARIVAAYEASGDDS